jgi:ribonuclease-3
VLTLSNFRILFSKNKKLSKFIYNILGFIPHNIFLYELAFTHKSIITENHPLQQYPLSNERLEFLGDAILGAIIAEFLYKKFPLKDEGFLTEMRSKIVSRNNLNKLAQKLHINDYLVCSISHNAMNSSIYGDAFEALIGAIYFDKGYKFAYKIITERIIKYHIDIENLLTIETNFKSKILEWSQKEKKHIEFRLIKEDNLQNNKLYTIELLIDNSLIAIGKDFSIKKAEQNAAEIALQKLSQK